MLKICTLLGILLTTALINTVSAQAEDTIYYFNKGNVPSKKEDAASYKVVSKKPDANGLYTVSEYSANGTLRMNGFSANEYGYLLVGEAKYYFPNGSKEKEGEYAVLPWNRTTYSEVGNWNYWWNNGQKFAERKYTQDAAQKETINYLVNHWDSTGILMVKDGNGTYENTFARIIDGVDVWHRITGKVKNGMNDGQWLCTYDGGKISYSEKYKAGELLKGTSYDKAGKKYNYKKVEEPPAFPGGDLEIIRFLQRNIRYPQMERDNDIQGRVMIRFFVDTDGSIKEPTLIRTVSPGIDRESMRVVKMLPNFIPGKQRGQPVRVYFTLPVVYKLQ